MPNDPSQSARYSPTVTAPASATRPEPTSASRELSHPRASVLVSNIADRRAPLTVAVDVAVDGLVAVSPNSDRAGSFRSSTHSFPFGTRWSVGGRKPAFRARHMCFLACPGVFRFRVSWTCWVVLSPSRMAKSYASATF